MSEFQPYYKSKPNEVISVMRELHRRGGLRKAMAGRDYDTLKPIVKFLCRWDFFHGRGGGGGVPVYCSGADVFSSMSDYNNCVPMQLGFLVFSLCATEPFGVL